MYKHNSAFATKSNYATLNAMQMCISKLCLEGLSKVSVGII